jgi:hypothetical protein
MFEIPFFNERIDKVGEPLRYLQWEEQTNVLHLFKHPYLFPAEYLVNYFRTINFTNMMAQYDNTTRTKQMKLSLSMFLNKPHLWTVSSRMKVTLSDYLVLDVSREDPLKDTLDQLWGMEKRMLLKPLKVKMGQHEGEVGADHGGVTYEFFRVVLIEAFKPDHGKRLHHLILQRLMSPGMFTLDAQTRMTWFQPGSLESKWKFEMIGILFSLAVYNGITLPVTFPLALYHALLPPEAPLRSRGFVTDSIDFIRDGWPDLARSFSQLLEWSDGDVADVMMRDYAFSYETFGQRIDHDMSIPYPDAIPSTPSSSTETVSDNHIKELKLVSNTNRHQFVKDYITHLTHTSITPQLRAFTTGFQTLLSPQSLYFFSPTSLRTLVEGTQHIDIPSLRNITRYEDGYSATHPTILFFWSIVEDFGQEDRRNLLEFVTASDRVPVTGYKGITFHIVRTGGADEGLLPASSTCFGKLYLPDYGAVEGVEVESMQGREVLRGKLRLAIGNARGFGVV